MNDISISWDPIDPELHRELIQYVYGIIGCMQYVHRLLGPGMPDFIYQEGVIKLSDILCDSNFAQRDFLSSSAPSPQGCSLNDEDEHFPFNNLCQKGVASSKLKHRYS